MRILDTFTELKANLTAELAERRKQYAYYRNQLLTFDADTAEWVTLGDIGPVRMCKRVLKDQTCLKGEVPFYKIGTFGGCADAFISQDMFEYYRSNYPFPKRGDVLLSAAGTIGRAIPFDGKPAYFQDSNIVWIDNDESKVLNTFLWYWYQTVQWSTDGSTIRRLYNDRLRSVKIPVPPLAEQRRIVTILDKFDALTGDIEIGLPAEIAARRKQYEYYREQLLNFNEIPTDHHLGVSCAPTAGSV